MENTKVVFKDDSIYGEVQLFSDDKKAGKMDISVADGKLRVYHTEVNPEHEGRGFAKLLLHQLVNYAKENNLRIIPLCPYVLAQFKRHPEDYADVWFKTKS
ncbi:N-acetyltransferase [Sphingobacterium alkalisoli]|uniref:N-acetyltransferase n=1 Tax=Sphingobacterium alkalisoli TaxID=1874115 RepID=A0A4U0H4J8_9SPHI|nr:GNAT family N-acetyltransferase [Sphingobacterium alkalisoli]TJY66621.1 N-acetyltransferase [Sphingobacterium alkalisoli]GGH15275.1 N-acetyltransferase [Sphingobacterium alkalisoli]